MDKQCNKCEETKPIDEFYTKFSNQDFHHTICKSCYKKEQREYYQSRRQYFLDYSKKQRDNIKLEELRKYKVR